jgi:hypothetical protein
MHKFGIDTLYMIRMHVIPEFALVLFPMLSKLL